jgi:transcriptional regulator with XRE-family HTH domain
VANDTANRLLARVKRLREGLGLTQEAFAEKAGLDYKYYQSVEAGRKRDIRLSTIEKLAKACGLKLWELLNLDADTSTALAEDPASHEIRPPVGKAARKIPKAKSGRKSN